MRFKPGDDFTAKDLVKAKGDTTIQVVATADGIIVGGMSYRLEPKSARTPTKGAPVEKSDAKKRTAEPAKKKR